MFKGTEGEERCLRIAKWWNTYTSISLFLSHSFTHTHTHMCSSQSVLKCILRLTTWPQCQLRAGEDWTSENGYTIFYYVFVRVSYRGDENNWVVILFLKAHTFFYDCNRVMLCPSRAFRGLVGLFEQIFQCFKCMVLSFEFSIFRFILKLFSLPHFFLDTSHFCPISLPLDGSWFLPVSGPHLRPAPSC